MQMMKHAFESPERYRASTFAAARQASYDQSNSTRAYLIGKRLSVCLIIASEVFFKIKLFLESLTEQIIFLIVKINNFWGDLSGISAKTPALIVTYTHPR